MFVVDDFFHVLLFGPLGLQELVEDLFFVLEGLDKVLLLLQILSQTVDLSVARDHLLRLFLGLARL